MQVECAGTRSSLAERISNWETGCRLHFSAGTVRSNVSTIIAKLQANDRTHAVITALRHDLVDLG